MVPLPQGHPLKINSVSQIVLFAVDTTVIISSRNFEDFCAVSNLVLSYFLSFHFMYYTSVLLHMLLGYVQLCITVYEGVLISP